MWCLSVCSFGGGRPFHPFVIRPIIHPFKFLILEEDNGKGGGRRRTNGSSSITVVSVCVFVRWWSSFPSICYPSHHPSIQVPHPGRRWWKRRRKEEDEWQQQYHSDRRSQVPTSNNNNNNIMSTNAGPKPFCWAKLTCFDFSSSNFHLQGHIMSTCGSSLSLHS